jgi:hypothetical protein
MAIGAVSIARVLAPDPSAAALLRGVAEQADVQFRRLLAPAAASRPLARRERHPT